MADDFNTGDTAPSVSGTFTGDTELPTAAAVTTANRNNPTAPDVVAWLYGLNGSGTDGQVVRNMSGSGDAITGVQGIVVGPVEYNGSTFDRRRNNANVTVLASSARTANTDSTDQTNYNGRGLHVVINVTAVTDTPSVVFTIQGKDSVSSGYYTILASAAIVGTGATVLRVFPGATAAANAAANDILPRTWRVHAEHADTDSITYSVGASVIL